MADGKGILAADESVGTFGKRLEQIGLENNADNRREWREIMFTTPGLEKYIGGVILFEEQLFQQSSEGKDLIQYLKEKVNTSYHLSTCEKRGIIINIYKICDRTL